jgi:hypothetical protein
MSFYGTLVIPTAVSWGGVASDARVGYSATDGLVMGGNGSSQDFILFNASALSVCYVPHNTRNMNFQNNVTAIGAVTSTGATAGVGYSSGAGGTVTQATSKSTGVTLNKVTGQITMNNAALASAAKVSFVVTNSAVVATDIITANVVSGGTANAYRAAVTAVGAGSFTVTVENITAGSLSEAPVIGFAVIKGVTA